MAIKKVRPFTIAEPTKVSEAKSHDTEAVPADTEALVDEKYCAENHVPVWSPDNEKEPAALYVHDEKHNLPTLFDPDLAAR